LLTASGVGMSYLFRTLFHLKNNLIAQISGLFYMFNIYTMVYMWRVFSSNVFAYSFLPWLLAFFLLSMRQTSAVGLIKYLFFFNFVAILSVPVFILFYLQI